jgi:hypothetical protein
MITKTVKRNHIQLLSDDRYWIQELEYFNCSPRRQCCFIHQFNKFHQLHLPFPTPVTQSQEFPSRPKCVSQSPLPLPSSRVSLSADLPSSLTPSPATIAVAAVCKRSTSGTTPVLPGRQVLDPSKSLPGEVATKRPTSSRPTAAALFPETSSQATWTHPQTTSLWEGATASMVLVPTRLLRTLPDRLEMHDSKLLSKNHFEKVG